MTDCNDIYVQIMPIIKSKSSNKIVLCKWNDGDYKDRFTGLIRAVDFGEESTNDAHFREKLATTAASILPENLSSYLLNVELVAKLHFTDPPAYMEYVHMVYLSDDAAKIKDIAFDDNPCDWFSWDEIPFHQMPQDDQLWYPKVLQEGLKVTGSFTFGSWSEKTLKSYHIESVSQL